MLIIFSITILFLLIYFFDKLKKKNIEFNNFKFQKIGKVSFLYIIFIIFVNISAYQIYLKYHYPKFIYGKSIDAIASYSDQLYNSDNKSQLFNIHNYLENKLGNQGAASFEYSLEKQNEALNNNFKNKYYNKTYFEDPEMGYLYVIQFLSFFKKDISLTDIQKFLIFINILSLIALYFSIKKIFSLRVSIFFNLIVIFYIPIYNILFSLYHHYILFPLYSFSLLFFCLIFSNPRFRLLSTLGLLILLSVCILIRTSSIIYFPILLILLFLYKMPILRILMLSVMFYFVSFMFNFSVSNSDFIKKINKFETNSHVVWYTFYTGLGETNKIIPGADDGYGIDLAQEKIPEVEYMSKEWDNFFFNESIVLINKNKINYFKLLNHRVKKVFAQKNNNWDFFILKPLKFFYQLFNYLSYLYLVICLYFLIFKKYLLRSNSGIMLISLFPICIGIFHILFFAKNYYYYYIFSFYYFIISSIMFDKFLNYLKKNFN